MTEDMGSSFIDKVMDAVVWVSMISVAIIALEPILQRILSVTPTARLYLGQQYIGLEDSRDLEATEELRWINLIDQSPYTAWITAYFFNDGPNTAYIAINRPYGFVELKVGESQFANFSMADRRIEVIYYMCGSGETALVRATGKY